MKPVRLQRSRKKGSRLKSPNGLKIVCVTRPGKFGNPWTYKEATAIVPELGYAIFSDAPDVRRDVSAQLVREFLFWLKTPHPGSEKHARLTEVRQSVIDSLPSLRGRNLACYCKLCPKHSETGLPLGEKCVDCAPCHADVLLEIANSEASQ